MNLRLGRAAAIALAMLAASVVSYVLTPRIKIADSRPNIPIAESFPKQFGDWAVDEGVPIVLPSADVQQRLDKVYNQVLTRNYSSKSGYKIMLSVAYGGDQSDALTLHRPEWCYPAQGFNVSSIHDDKLLLGSTEVPITRMTTTAGTRHEPVTYWIVSGDHAVGARWSARLVQLQYGFRGVVPDGMLIRISSIDQDGDRAFREQDAFAQQMVASMSRDWRTRLGAG